MIAEAKKFQGLHLASWGPGKSAIQFLSEVKGLRARKACGIRSSRRAGRKQGPSSAVRKAKFLRLFVRLIS